MSRLTFVDEDGNVLFGVNGADADEGYTIFQLAEEGMADELEEIANRLANAEQRLEYYEDLEEQGRLIELPCKIGDYVYKIHNNDWKTYFRGEGKELGIIKSVFTYKDIPGIGTLVFLTKEEAEAKLAEVKGE